MQDERKAKKQAEDSLLHKYGVTDSKNEVRWEVREDNISVVDMKKDRYDGSKAVVIETLFARDYKDVCLGHVVVDRGNAFCSAYDRNGQMVFYEAIIPQKEDWQK